MRAPLASVVTLVAPGAGSAGAVIVYQGGPSGLGATPARTLTGPSGMGSFGALLARRTPVCGVAPSNALFAATAFVPGARASSSSPRRELKP